MTTLLTFKLTFVTRFRLCVLDCVQLLPEVGENHTGEKLNKTTEKPPKPSLFLVCIIKMLFEDRMKIFYTLLLQQRRKYVKAVIRTFSQKSFFGIL